MGTFFKTFLICLIMALGFLFYKFVGNNSYSPDLKVSNDMFNFNLSKDENDTSSDSEAKNEPIKNVVKEESQKVEEKLELKEEKPKETTYNLSCYFYAENGQLVKSTKTVNKPVNIKDAVVLLLKGPLVAESKKGIYSEIPANVDLISLKQNSNNITINLSSNFENNGSFQSIENRLRQLSKTIKLYNKNAKIYLQINGKQAEYLGGDGVYVKQPLEY